MKEETFFGSILFDTFRQNFASEVKVLQVIRKIRNLKEILTPAVVLPLRLATASLQLPQPNRYNPVSTTLSAHKGATRTLTSLSPASSARRAIFRRKQEL